MVKSKLVQGGDGTEVASIFVGACIGDKNVGTNGNGFTTKTSNALASTLATVAVLTLNKGAYLVSGSLLTNHSDGTNRNVRAQWLVGGTPVGHEQVITLGTGLGGAITMPAIPVNITADGTAVAIAAYIQSLSGASGGNAQQMSAIRIA